VVTDKGFPKKLHIFHKGKLNVFTYYNYSAFKAADLQMLKKIFKKIMVNTGQVMFGVEIYYY